jgi:hypothetical protein
MATGGPNQTATPFPVVDFMPTKQYPSFSGPINEKLTITPYLGTTTALTAAVVLGGFITSSNAAAQTLTLPTAALLVPQIEGAEVGTAIRLIVNSVGAGTATVAAGTGGTFAGTATVAAGSLKQILLVVTALDPPAYTVYSLGSTVY